MRLSYAILYSTVLHTAGFAYATLRPDPQRPPQKAGSGHYAVALMLGPKATTPEPPAAKPKKLSRRAQSVVGTTEQAPPVPEETPALGGSADEVSGQAAAPGDANPLPETGGVANGDQDALLKRYHDAVYWAVEQRKEYPVVAERSGVQGTVYLEVTLDEQGCVVHAEIAQSSGSEILDRAALKLLQNMELPRPPEGLKATQRRLQIPLHYRLS